MFVVDNFLGELSMLFKLSKELANLKLSLLDNYTSMSMSMTSQLTCPKISLFGSYMFMSMTSPPYNSCLLSIASLVVDALQVIDYSFHR